MLCSEPAQQCLKFRVLLTVLCEPPEGKLRVGYQPTLDAHAAHVRCEVSRLAWRRSKKGDHLRHDEPAALAAGDMAEAWIVPLEPICIEVFRTCPGLGRIALRDRGVTVAAGIVTLILRIEGAAAYLSD
ncbi:unnamed protein product [Polarella glacialis]|uniref:GTP-eEF1A C-terminal domain-containing protein n=1 Tax=Polarella glacialis TaxID=89957 RepID=A0A813EAX5_POLGL|nr:unnamed protein product [Polarella glacialis]